MQNKLRNLIQPALYALALALCVCGVMKAQVVKRAPTNLLGKPSLTSPSAPVSVTVAAVPNGTLSSALLAVFAENGNIVYGVSLNGVDALYSNANNGLPAMACGEFSVYTCTATITVFNGVIYITYVDRATQGLDVVVATPIPGQFGYNMQLFHQDATLTMTSSPTATVYNGYLVIFFSGSTAEAGRGFYGLGFNGTTWTEITKVATF